MVPPRWQNCFDLFAYDLLHPHICKITKLDFKELAVRSIITSSPRGSGGLEGEVAAAGQYADSIIIESSRALGKMRIVRSRLRRTAAFPIF
jgi:hypothetical protein